MAAVQLRISGDGNTAAAAAIADWLAGLDGLQLQPIPETPPAGDTRSLEDWQRAAGRAYQVACEVRDWWPVLTIATATLLSSGSTPLTESPPIQQQMQLVEAAKLAIVQLEHISCEHNVSIVLEDPATGQTLRIHREAAAADVVEFCRKANAPGADR